MPSSSKEMSTSQENKKLMFHSPIFASHISRGVLKLPPVIQASHINLVPTEVYLKLPNGAQWCGNYNKDNGCIEGLHHFLHYHAIKPYTLAFYVHEGGPNFKIKLFNPYAIEINYQGRSLDSSFTAINGDSVPTTDHMTDVEIDKWETALKFNGYNIYRNTVNIHVKPEHLEKSCRYEILTKEDCVILNIGDSCNVISLGFENYSWKVPLIRENGNIYLGCRWNTFAAAAKLHVDDMCIITQDCSCGNLKVAVFSFSDVPAPNHDSREHPKTTKMKFFKIINQQTMDRKILVFPQLLTHKLPQTLSHNMELFMADGQRFTAKYCWKTMRLNGLERMFTTYSIIDGYLIHFEYLGCNRFYTSIYDDNCMNIFNHVEKKLRKADIVIDPTISKLVHVYKGLHDGQCSDMKTAPATNNQQQITQGMCSGSGYVGRKKNYFTSKLTKSNVNKSGHGVYLPKKLLPLYTSWKKQTEVNLTANGLSWKLKLNKRGKVCRFGIGWDDFTKDNGLSEGDNLGFEIKEADTLICEVSFLP